MSRVARYIESYKCDLREKMTNAQRTHYRINEIASQRGGMLGHAQRQQITAIEAMWKEIGGKPYVELADYDDSGVVL